MTCDDQEDLPIWSSKKALKRRYLPTYTDDDDLRALGHPHSRKKKLLPNSQQIDSEFRMLQSLIPNIAGRHQLNELEIIDECVKYIETLQNQLQTWDSTSPAPVPGCMEDQRFNNDSDNVTGNTTVTLTNRITTDSDHNDDTVCDRAEDINGNKTKKM